MQMIAMTLYSFMILSFSQATMDTFDRIWKDTEPLLFITWNLTQLHTQGLFLQWFLPACMFLHWSIYEVTKRIEIPYPALFPLRTSNPNPINTQNLFPARICNCCLPPPFELKSQISQWRKANPTTLPNLLGHSCQSCDYSLYSFSIYVLVVHFPLITMESKSVATMH